jgi:hypothetical protein
MKIQKEFAPTTITLETKEDRNEFLCILYAAEWQWEHMDSGGWLSRGSCHDGHRNEYRSKAEKVRQLIKDLQ